MGDATTWQQFVTGEWCGLNTSGSQCKWATTDVVHDPVIKIPEYRPATGKTMPGSSWVNSQAELAPSSVKKPEGTIDIGCGRGCCTAGLICTTKQHRQASNINTPTEETFIEREATSDGNDSGKR